MSQRVATLRPNLHLVSGLRPVSCILAETGLLLRPKVFIGCLLNFS
jgi:hypothetical protein